MIYDFMYQNVNKDLYLEVNTYLWQGNIYHWKSIFQYLRGGGLLKYLVLLEVDIS
jgi:hypothetical protein